MHELVSDSAVLTFDGTVVELFTKSRSETWRTHVAQIKEAVIVEKRLTTRIKISKGSANAITFYLDETHRDAADALIAAIEQALLERGGPG